MQFSKLRGDRYLDDKNPKSLELAKFITEELHYLDFDPTMRWYMNHAPKLDTKQVALLGCNDRFFLLTSLCHRVDAIHPWLFQRCREIEADPYGYLDLWARFHYKSTLGTFAGCIQSVVIDPEITIAIMSCTNDVARPFLTQIQQELETNEDLKITYPDVLWADPRKEASQWSRDKGITVKRNSNPKECTIEAFGVVDGMRTGKHYRKHVYDDLVTEKLVTSEEMVAKVTERYELADNLGSDKGTDKEHYGTRYSYGDTYGVLMQRGTLKPRKYAATDDGTLKGNPVFLTEKRWAEIKKVQRKTAAAQMLQNPLADTEQVFSPFFFRPYFVRPAIMNVYVLVDPSKGATDRSDRTGMPVIGIDPASNMYLLDGFRHRMPLSERWQRIKSLHKRWSGELGVQMVKVGYEIYGQQADAEVLKDYMQREKYWFSLTELNTPRQGKHSKGDRIERLEPDMRESRFYLPGLIWNTEQQCECLWSIWSEKDHEAAKGTPEDGRYNVGDVVFRPLKGELKSHAEMRKSEQLHRIVRPIKRKNEDGSTYDLTREFMEEAQFYPFAPKKDLIDAASRIYDIEASPPQAFKSEAVEPKSFPDS